MSDRWAVAMAGSAWIGVWTARPIPWWVGALVVLVAFTLRRPAVLCLGVALLASTLGARALAPVAALDSMPYDGWAVVETDPVRRTGGGVALDLRVAQGRVAADAYGAAAAALRDRLVGQRVRVSGRLRPVGEPSPWLELRGVRGRMAVDQVNGWEPAGGARRVANVIRGVLDDGASVLPTSDRELFTGVVFGDDREFPPVLADDFRAAGLTHLVAVSGQNVVFVLALGQPLIRWFGYRGRWVATLGLLGLFALVTRFEPSVMRATAMAGVAATAAAMGREATSRRVLGVAVTLLVLAQPRLVASLGFQLSVLATAGIAVAARPVTDRLPGPRPLAAALGVTLAAQAAVAPLLVATFGGVPVLAVPANVLAAPTAGALMMWGITGGAVAGLTGAGVAAVLHVPTHAFTWWLQWVAAAAARIPAGRLGPVHLALLMAAWPVAVLVRRARWPALALAVLVVVHPGVALARAPDGVVELAAETRIWTSGSVTVLEVGRGAHPEPVLEALRLRGVRRVDLAILHAGGVRDAEVLHAVRQRYRVEVVWAPRRWYVPDAVVPEAGVVELDRLHLVVDGDGVVVTSADGG